MSIENLSEVSSDFGKDAEERAAQVVPGGNAYPSSETREETDMLYFRTEGLTVGYNGVPLIRDIELSMKRGEILTLIGPNGAGKTTILKNIIRQLEPIGGTVFLDGRKLPELSGHELSTQMSVVLTERVKPELMSCEDVVATGRYPYTGRFGVLSEEDHRIVRESMELVHISELKERDFSETSDGQKQRVMLARALCQQPDILVLDEPTSFLDIRYKLEFLAIIQEMSRKRGLSVIMSLHELDLAGRISDKLACIRGDKVDRFGTPEEIFTEGYIQELYQMTVGSYDERTGNLELTPVKGDPEVFVIAGNDHGTDCYRSLQWRGIPFATGILWENDLDFPMAHALAAELVSVPAFHEISTEELRRAKEIMDRCGHVICTLDENAYLPDALQELIAYAESKKYIEI
ncbi:MAG: ABC transporter ATP-binding protein [Lachnospiraceae bacterium]|nr:ABC transporter ATP-binding protein [Lachnospiraceae bacterium]